MIRYNFRKIRNSCSHNEYDVVGYFRYLAKQEIRISKNLRIKYVKLAALPDRPNFLYNLQELVQNEYNVKFVYNYIVLASARSLFEYNKKLILSLPIWRIPDYAEETAKWNPLLKFDNRNVHFKYEQIKQR